MYYLIKINKNIIKVIQLDTLITLIEIKLKYHLT